MKVMDITSISDDIRNLISNDVALVKRVGIFGSLARGDFDNASDIDVLIEYASTPEFIFERFNSFCRLCNDLSDSLNTLYNRGVDIVQFEKSPENTLGADIEGEIIWL